MGGETMVGFGAKQAWLAIQDAEPTAVIAALGARDLGPVSWRQGIDLAYLTDDWLAVTPPLPGAPTGDARWVLVVGRWLLREASTIDVAKLSAVLDSEVQFFATHRVVELHRWERAVNGALVRAFGFLGETGELTDWRGEPDAAEVAIGLAAHPADEVDTLVSEHDVMRLAGLWSVNPTLLDALPAPGPLRAAAAP